MPIIESIITKAVTEIVKKSTGKAWKGANRNEKVLKVLGAVGLKPGTPDENFESVYAYTLVEYGIEKPQPVLNFFRHEDIRKAFQQTFEKNQPSVLNQEAEHLIQWNKIGDELRGQQLDPRLDFAGFALVFH